MKRKSPKAIKKEIRKLFRDCERLKRDILEVQSTFSPLNCSVKK